MHTLQLPATAWEISESARERMLSLRGEPLFLADWSDVLMIHLRVDPETLQRQVPFELDLFDGAGFVTLVAFTMRDMRPRLGGSFGRWLLKPIASHRFLNVRTYVRHKGEPGIYFMTEWLSNRLSVALGPPVFGLPYRWGKLDYDHEALICGDSATGTDASGRVEDQRTGARLTYCGVREPGSEFAECEPGSLSQWLMERYTAFTCCGGKKRFFRVWHAPWRQVPVRARIVEPDLIVSKWPLLEGAELVVANYSCGARDVWMGRPHRL